MVALIPHIGDGPGIRASRWLSRSDVRGRGGLPSAPHNGQPRAGASEPGRGRTVLVTSAAPQEGKTVIARNLGTVMAQVGKRVLVVETDLRRPTFRERLDLRTPKGGSSMS